MMSFLKSLLRQRKEKGSANHIRVGKRGERAARWYLLLRGFRILERNYETKYGEIDIIAVDGDTVAFVEVKTRKSSELGEPEEAVTYTKQKKLSICARHYIHKKRLYNRNARFDIISVKTGRFLIKEIKLIKDAFRIT